MRLVLLFILLSLSLNFALAKDEGSFTYEYRPQVERPFNLELFQLSAHFEEQDFDRLSSTPSGNIPFLHVDEVLTSVNGKGLIFINMSLRAPENLFHKVLSMKTSTGENFYLYHTKEVSIAFFDLKEWEVKKLVRDLHPSATDEVVTSIKNLILPEAHADTIACRAQVQNPYGSLESVSSAVEKSLLLKRVGECAVSAFKGAGKGLEETADFYKKLLTDPGALWGDVKKAYEAFKTLAMNFTNELQKAYEGISNLTLDEKIEIGCTMIGQTASGIAVGILTGGAAVGAVKLLSSMVPKLLRMSGLLAKLKRYKVSTQAAKDSLSCAI